jgi:hypothetical protein
MSLILVGISAPNIFRGECQATELHTKRSANKRSSMAARDERSATGNELPLSRTEGSMEKSSSEFMLNLRETEEPNCLAPPEAEVLLLATDMLSSFADPRPLGLRGCGENKASCFKI